MALTAYKDTSELKVNDIADTLSNLPALALSSDLHTRTILSEFFKLQDWSIDGVIDADQIQAVEILSQSSTPPFVLIDVNDIVDPVAYLEQLSNVCDESSQVLVIGKDNRIQTYHAIKALGVMDYLPKPLSISDIEDCFTQNEETELVLEQKEANATSIAVIGARGGAGATTIALEIARAALPRDITKKLKSSKMTKAERNTVLLDLDIHFGSTALYTDIQPTHALVDALSSPERIDDLFLERSTITLDNGMQLLAAEDDPSHLVEINEESLDILFSRLTKAFKTAVIDCPKYILPQFSSIAKQLDHLVIVLEPNIANLRDAIRITSWVDSLEKKPEIHVVLNKIGQSKNADLSAKDIAQTLGRTPVASLPFSIDAFAEATEKGIAVTDVKPPKQVKIELGILNKAIFGEEEAPKKISLMKKLLGRQS
ncbi:P-loop NTPase family protein [Curvivirga aplysinae]|uniref:hypothetical protein n=1 Tax=Curvivirga aplysinae TaxID=2529852 RepID=UPI0012BB6D13|nr:hypothetical protein [Curvivirga aplysinae]MTI08630.1 hypothetical protein [Curvivirga aplysinae]